MTNKTIAKLFTSIFKNVIDRAVSMKLIDEITSITLRKMYLEALSNFLTEIDSIKKE